ncbi:hypothetical protein GP5015_1268 [gamma proteobacterium HTCC5015]|nr:hypothetical protein GP5015_1268 [gamma proteobacterium HTCC5015]
MPASSSDANAPTVTRSETDVSYSSGTQVSLPVDYEANNGNLSEILFAVEGAYSYFSVSLSDAASSGVFVLPLGIPSNVDSGQFCVDVKLVDSSGLVSAEQTICITVIPPLACDTKKVSGGEGVTNTLHEMGTNPGTVLVDYETYTVKDKIDIFQNGQWVAGTGPSTSRSSIRTALDCAQATEALGYVGENSEFLFAYDPALGGDVEVVVSGCENSGTAWEYTASCPGEFGMCTVDSDCATGETCVTGTCVKEGVLRFSLTWSALNDLDLHVKAPNGTLLGFDGASADSVVDGEWDTDNTFGGSGAVENIYFGENLQSGTYEYYVNNFDGNASSWKIEVFEEGALKETRTGSFASGTEGDDSTKYNYTYTP